MGTEVTCPWHGAVFDVTSGAVRGAPAPRDVAAMPFESKARTSKSNSNSQNLQRLVTLPIPNLHAGGSLGGIDTLP
jgi:Rieske Fe-S protein